MTTAVTAEKNPTQYRFKIGEGYTYLGEPRMPAEPIGEPSACEPPAPAADGSMHLIRPPKGADLMPMRWNPTARNWTPLPLGLGRRMAYTSAFLAADGWTYEEPYIVPEE